MSQNGCEISKRWGKGMDLLHEQWEVSFCRVMGERTPEARLGGLGRDYSERKMLTDEY